MSRTIVVTGARGFIGRHVVHALSHLPDLDVVALGRDSSEADTDAALARADVVIHLAAANRPPSAEGFVRDNVEYSNRVARALADAGRSARVVLSSSLQAGRDSDYGRSKAEAERIWTAYAAEAGADVRIFRLVNVFGKWARPGYNSVVATFSHAIANGAPYDMHDRGAMVRLIHVDDAVSALVRAAVDLPLVPGAHAEDAGPVFDRTLGELESLLLGFRDSRRTLQLPALGDPFVRRLYATYVAYLPESGVAYSLVKHEDPRGSLAEVLKSPDFGQIFLSRTKPGITRGNHWHHTKTEKFIVVQGRAVIRFRAVEHEHVFEVPVEGHEYRVVDIPPGYAHSITNVGDDELVTLFWASEIFDPARPDTYPREA